MTFTEHKEIRYTFWTKDRVFGRDHHYVFLVDKITTCPDRPERYNKFVLNHYEYDGDGYLNRITECGLFDSPDEAEEHASKLVEHWTGCEFAPAVNREVIA